MTTIKGSTNSEGLFTPNNPYRPMDGLVAIDPKSKFWQWSEQHPPALCYNSDNQLVIGLNDVDVTGPLWQWDYKPPAMSYGWRNASPSNYTSYTFEQFAHANRALQTRQIYFTVPPSDSHPLDGDREEESDNEYMDAIIECRIKNGIMNKDGSPTEKTKISQKIADIKQKLVKQTELLAEAMANLKTAEVRLAETRKEVSAKADAQPVKNVEEIKTAEEMLNEYSWGDESGYQHADMIEYAERFHSQFATEAGGDVEAGKVEFIYRHADGTELISPAYTILEVLEKSEDEIQEDTCDCDCQPTGEASYKDCNCADYYDRFELVGHRVRKPNNLVDVEAVIKKLDLISENILSYKITEDVDANDHMYNQGINRGIFEINKIRQSLSK